MKTQDYKLEIIIKADVSKKSVKDWLPSALSEGDWKYKVVKLKKSFFSQCINNSDVKKFEVDNYIFNLKVPNLFNDYLLRYVEFYEYFWTGEKKSWHLELIKSKLEKSEYGAFLDHLNHYIKPPIVPEKKYIKILYFYKDKLVLKYYIKKFLYNTLNDL